jgi:hypothetical protein
MMRKLQLENSEENTEKPTPIKAKQTQNGLYPVAAANDKIQRKKRQWRSRHRQEAARD